MDKIFFEYRVVKVCNDNIQPSTNWMEGEEAFKICRELVKEQIKNFKLGIKDFNTRYKIEEKTIKIKDAEISYKILN